VTPQRHCNTRRILTYQCHTV